MHDDEVEVEELHDDADIDDDETDELTKYDVMLHIIEDEVDEYH